MGKTKDIRKAVEAELDFDPLVDPANITSAPPPNWPLPG